MMRLTIFQLYLLQIATACVIYHASAPFDNDAPFQATIEDNGVTTCWISKSYNAHAELQTAYSLSHARELSLLPKPASSSAPKADKQPSTPARSNYRHISLTEIPPLHPSSQRAPPPHLGRRKMVVPSWEEQDDWIPWRFECLAGFRAHADVGLRTIVYRVKNREYFFVPGMREDIYGEKWEFKGSWWCDAVDKIV